MNRKQRRGEKSQVRSTSQGATSTSAAPRVQALFADAFRHHQEGRVGEAERLYREILAIDANHSDSLHLLGLICYQFGRHDLAADLIGKAIAINPKMAEYHANMGIVLRALKRPDEAIACYRRALALKPDFVAVHNNLGNALQELGRSDEAVASYRAAIKLKPDLAETHFNLGNALRDMSRLPEAVASYLQAIRIRPDYAIAHNNLGIELINLGRLDQARVHLGKATELDPGQAAFHYNLAEAKRFTAADPQIAMMEALAGQLESLPAQDQVHLLFALGKAYDDIGEKARSFDMLLAGNARQRRLEEYDEGRSLALFERIQAVFTDDLIKSKGVTAPAEGGPIFIVGMPRSGTTLVEQILASHPEVFGAGEVELFEKATFAAVGTDNYPEAMAALPSEGFRRIGTDYLRELRAGAAGANRITDKLVENFLFCGAIHLALPNARIIHTRREPLDTCLSCFSKLFTSSRHPYSNDLAELGRYYHSYEKLMEHWRRVLPENVFLEVSYEDVVDDLEGQARRVLAHCGLEWDDACLAFHKTERAVRTASASQVRQPIYKTSVGRWRPGADLLKPLTDAIGAG